MRNAKLIEAWNCITPSSDDKEKMLRNICLKAATMHDAKRHKHSYGFQNWTSRLMPKENISIPLKVNRRTLLLGVLILGLLSVSAFAITQQVKLVDWNGNPKMEDDFVSAMTEEETALMHARAKKAKEFLKNAPDNEIWMAEIWEDTQVSHTIQTKFDSLEQMKQYVKDADQEMLILTRIPDGYHFVSGGLSYFVSKETHDAGLELLEEDMIGDGILLKKFRVLGPYQSDIESFSMTFCDDQGNRLVFGCYRDEAQSRYSFNLGADGKSEAVSVNGMADGLYIQDESREFENTLYLRKNEMSPKTYYPWPIPLTYSDMDDQPAVPFDFDSATYSLQAQNLDKDQLIKIADSLR